MATNEHAALAMTAMPSADPLLNDRQVEELTGIATGTLRWWRHKAQGDGPRWFRLGPKAIRYRKSDVEAWIEEHYAKAHADV